MIEPPLLESATVVVDLLIGHETLVFPRLVSVLAWLLAGIALWAIGRRVLGPVGALAAVGLFELLPFAVLATRGFQPDPMAVGALLLAVLAPMSWAERPSGPRLAAAAAAAGAAILLKADFAPFVVGGHIAATLTSGRRNSWRDLARPVHAVWFVAAVLPAALWSLLVSLSKLSLAQRVGTYFVDHFLVTRTFWHQLAGEWSDVFGLAVIAGAVIGLLLAAGRVRVLLASGVVAYTVFVIAFDYRVATHSYYQLPFMPFVALACGCAADWVWRWVAGRSFMPVLGGALGASAVAVVAVAVATQHRLPPPARGREEVAAARVVGAALCHPARTVFVDAAYGMPLEYHGEMPGTAWPWPGDLAYFALHHEEQPGAAARLAALEATGSRYVIVTDEVMLSAEPDLQRALRPYPILMRGAGYCVWDLAPALPSHCAGGPG